MLYREWGENNDNIECLSYEDIVRVILENVATKGGCSRNRIRRLFNVFRRLQQLHSSTFLLFLRLIESVHLLLLPSSVESAADSSISVHLRNIVEGNHGLVWSFVGNLQEGTQALDRAIFNHDTVEFLSILRKHQYLCVAVLDNRYNTTFHQLQNYSQKDGRSRCYSEFNRQFSSTTVFQENAVSWN